MSKRSKKKNRNVSDEVNELEKVSDLTDELSEAEKSRRETFRKTWIGCLIAFGVVCIGLIIYFAFFREKSHVKLGQYKGLYYTSIDTTVSDKEVSDEKERLINKKIKYEKLSDRNGTPVVDGDVANCTYKASLSGEVIEEGSGNFEIGSGEFKDFEEQLKGKIIGDSLTISVEIPENYIGDEELKECAGETVDFDVTINFVSKKNVPELTDELVTDITGGECKSVDGFDSYVKDTIAAEKELDAKADIINELLDQVIANSEFNDIDNMVQEYYDTMYETYVSAAEYYELSMGEYIRQFYQRELEDFQKELKSTMVDLVKEQLVLKAIVDKENLRITDELYDKYMTQYLNDYGYTDKEAFIEYYGAESIEESMLYDYAIDFVVEKAEAK